MQELEEPHSVSQLSKVRTERQEKKATRHISFTLVAVIALVAVVVAFLAFGGGTDEPENALGLRNLQPAWEHLQTDADLYSYADSKTQVTAAVGVDVSTYQGTVDWNAVKAAGVEFAMVRLGFRGYGNGKLVLDEQFQQNAEGANAAGLNVGIYFYSQALNAEEAREEADFVLTNMQGLDIDYPVVYDQEDYTADEARTDDLTGEQATANALAFCQTIQNAGYLPMVYMNGHWASTMYDLDALSDYLIWYADYREEPTLSSGFAMWQYTNEGTIPGIESQSMDLNLLFLPDEKD